MKKVLAALLLALMMVPAAGASDSPGQKVVSLSDFADTQGSTAIGYFYLNGVIDGFPGGNFEPALPLTNAQLAKILTRLYRPSLLFEKTFPDIAEDHWAYPYLRAAGSYIAGEGGKLNPEEAVTGTSLKKALENLTEAEITGEWAAGGPLTRSQALEILFGFQKERPFDKPLLISEEETIPPGSSIQYANTVFSNRPLYFSSPEYGSFGEPDDFAGYAYASWDEKEQKAVFYAKAYVQQDVCYEFILKELAFCGREDTMNTISGSYDILRNGELVKEAVSAKAYGFENEYFKFYSEGEAWHFSAFVTSRHIGP